MYIESILALQAKAGGNAQLPLAIMTSGDTHARTQELLEKNHFFGMQPTQVTLLQQEEVLRCYQLIPDWLEQTEVSAVLYPRSRRVQRALSLRGQYAALPRHPNFPALNWPT